MANNETEEEIRIHRDIRRSLLDYFALQKAVLDCANYMIIATDVEGTITYFNPAAERDLGYKAEEVVGRCNPEPFHDVDEVVSRAAELSAETGHSIEPGFEVFVHNPRLGKVEEREWTYIRKDGTKFPITLSATALRDEAGEITGFLGIADDISEKKRAVEEIQAADERFKAFMDHSPVAASLKDSEGRYVFINKTMEQVFDVSLENLKGRTDFDWLPEETARSMHERDKTILEGGEPMEFTQTITLPDGIDRTWHTYKFAVHDGAAGAYVGAVAFDTTEQQDTERALRKSEQHSRDLIEKSPGLISTHTLEGVLLSVNPAAAHALGYEPEELVGKSLRDFLPPDRQKLFGEFLRHVEANKGASGTMRLINRRGEERTWSYTNTIYEEGGKPYVLGHAFDVTESMLAEVALRQTEERMRLFIEHTPAAVAMLDCEMNYVMTSRRWLTDYNLGEQNIIGRNHYDIFPDLPVHWKNIHQRGMRGEVLKCDEDPFPRADGTVEWLHWEMYPWRDNQGEIGGIIFFTEVITERKRMEEQISLSGAIVESSQDAIFSETLDGIVKSWNRGAELTFGYQADEIIGRHVSVLFPPELLEEEAAFIRKIKNGESLRLYETVRVKKNGERFPVSLTLSPVTDEKGNIIGISKIARDITSQREAEAQLRIARDSALESAKLKSEFLSNMSHEIRTPMNGVIGMTDMLLTTSLSKEQRELAEIIKSSADGLLTIINDILDFSKIEAGKLYFETIDFDLLDTVESTVELFAKESQHRNIELASLIESDVNTKLRGDPGRLRQVLTNLIGNALKFTEEGEVIVRITKEAETENNCRLHFHVSDTGIGIQSEVQQDLFQAFTQADGTMTRKYGGTGLGLAISKQLVERMGGDLKVDSEYGKGSVFSFTANFEKQTVENTRTIVPLSSLENLRVLIVDDNKTNRTVLNHQVTSWGMIANEAADGPTALVRLREAAENKVPYRLAILDLMMPGLNGFELAYFIKGDPQISEIKLILMPSFGQRGHPEAVRENGIDRYLVKPVRQSELFDCIATLMAEDSNPPKTENDVLVMAPPATQIVTQPILQEKRRSEQGIILIAEDNLVNQKLARMQLEQLGYQADVASNGLEALNALKLRSYSLILMDCQMPEMDGYTASREIRRLEGGTRHIPIIAMTANAMQGEREKCLAAGMDEYITKPVNIALLSGTISRLLGTKKDRRNEPDPSIERTSIEKAGLANLTSLDNSVLDQYRVLQKAGTPDLVTELIDTFIVDSTRRMKILKAAVTDQDRPKITEQAHTFKGSAGNVGALKLAMYAELIEQNLNDLVAAQALSNEMADELEKVIELIKIAARKQ
ncbi:MAG: PAS domain S-box protein [Acidobacteriota bacterium]